MDATKKRKADENGVVETLTPSDARKLLEPLTHEQLLFLLQDALTRHPDVLSSARSLADTDVTRRKLFVRGLGPETTTESLKSLFSSYGDLDEAVVITDKNTGKSKGYGFVTYKHVDGALLALRQPSKKIDGRMTVTHLASAGRGGPNAEDQVTRKIYVGNVPYEVSAERLLEFFSQFGEIEEGPLGFDRQGGKLKGFAFFVYRTEEGARTSLLEPMKVIDGHQVMCKLAEDGKKGKVGAPLGPGEVAGERMGMMGSNSMNPPPYGGPMGSYGGYGLGPTQGSAMGGGGQGPPSMGGPSGGGGYSAPLGGSYGGPQYGGPGSAEYSSYRVPPQSSMGMPPQSSIGVPPPGPYQESGGYGMSSSGYMSQTHPPSQAPPQGPPGGMYQRMPPSYY